MGENKFFKTGNYTGNGSSQSIEVGFKPRIVKIFRWNETYPQTAFKNDQMPDDDYLEHDVGGLEKISSNGITITDTGFDVGSENTINANGNTFLWEAYN